MTKTTFIDHWPLARNNLKLSQKFPPPSSKSIPCLWAGQTNNGAALPWCGQPMVSIGNKWQSRQFLRKIFAATKVKRNVTTSCSFMKSVRCHVSTNFFSLHLLNEWVNQQEEAFSLYKRLIPHCNLPFCMCFSDKANIRNWKYYLHRWCIMMHNHIQYRFHQQVCDEQNLIDFFKAAKIQCWAECFVREIPVHCPCDAGVGVMGEVKGLSAVRCKLGFTFPATTLRTTQTLLSAAVKTSACQLKPPKH